MLIYIYMIQDWSLLFFYLVAPKGAVFVYLTPSLFTSFLLAVVFLGSRRLF